VYNLPGAQTTVNDIQMDIGIIAALAMLILWAVLTFTTEAPGLVHLLLTAGIFLLIERIVARGKKRSQATRGGRERK